MAIGVGQRMGEREMTMVIPLRPGKVAALRRSLRALLCRYDLPHELVNDVVLSAQEACNNAIVHSCDRRGKVEVAAGLAEGRVCIEVRDRGQGFDVSSVDVRCPPDVLSPSGRGLYLIHQLMDDVDVRSGKGGTTVRMTKSVPQKPSAG